MSSFGFIAAIALPRLDPCWQTPASVWHNQGVTVTTRQERQPRKARPPLGPPELERLALAYVGRFATSRGKLVEYLRRKVRERGWEGAAPDLAGLAERFAGLGYIDDRAFAEGRARSLGARGYGKGRVRQALHAAGIGQEDATSAGDIADDNRWASALRYAEKKRIGPWARAVVDRPAREKVIGAMIRAGHDFAAARAIASAAPGEVPEDVSR